MVFCVIFIDSDGKVGQTAVDYPEYDIIGISRKARKELPGINVYCVIPRK